MTFAPRLMYPKLEQDEILRIADRVEEALTQAMSEEFASRLKALADSHSLDRGLTGIGEHCHSEDRAETESSNRQCAVHIRKPAQGDAHRPHRPTRPRHLKGRPC